jgi:hypothetical protein
MHLNILQDKSTVKAIRGSLIFFIPKLNQLQHDLVNVYLFQYVLFGITGLWRQWSFLSNTAIHLSRPHSPSSSPSHARRTGDGQRYGAPIHATLT